MSINENFSSRWGLILASLGMAIGAGNLWRFPRLAGQYGGAFLSLWILFLLIWSIPILMAEFSIGKRFKRGVIGSFGEAVGSRFAWMGFFIAICTLGITFYYSVVTAWGLRYLGFAIGDLVAGFSGELTLSDRLTGEPGLLTDYWAGVSNASLLTIGLHIAAVSAGGWLLHQGIQNGLEKANRILIPTLFVLLVIISIFAISTGNGISGLDYMFAIDVRHFYEPAVWIEALSQSAWSTGAGWGLIMTISSYSRAKEDVTLNTFISGFGNNTASMVAAMAILPSVFALASSEQAAIEYLQAGNQALTFSVIPQLFAKLPGGGWLSVIFFAAFAVAAFSSLLAMMEMFIKILGDLGFNRNKAAVRASVFCIAFGLPSAYSLEFFSNQDWVWGIGLVISGFFIVFAVLKTGIRRFKEDMIDQDSDFIAPLWYFRSAILLNVALAVVLVYWWMSQGYDANPWFTPDGNWNLMGTYSNATIVTQWGVVLVIGLLLNRYIYLRFSK